MTILLDNPIPFRGGVRLAANKAQSLEKPTTEAFLPSLLTIPLRQHIGSSAIPIVKVGEQVLKGQEIAHDQGFISATIHASSSGKIVEIANRPVPNPSGHSVPCIVIETDAKDEWIEHAGVKVDPYELSPIDIHDRIHAAGIVGLGGAGFPAAVKMLPGVHSEIHLLILNAAECEPYITCDESLMQTNAKEIIDGLEIIRHAVQARECVIGIEDNKIKAIAALRQAIDDIGETSIEVVSLPTIYPAGSEKQLIKSLTGLEVPAQGLPLDLNIVCYNVGTVYAIYNAITYGEPLVSRVVTITGEAIKQPQNLKARIGTPINELIKQCGGYIGEVDRMLIGGPMMGFTLHNDTAPVIKTTNCVIATTAVDVPLPQPVLPCIRCGDCAAVCPVNLLPQQLYWYARANDYDKVQDFKLFDCIECACCDYVCPSHIPLVKYYQSAKAEIWDQERQRMKSDQARQRFNAHNARIELEQEQRELEQPQPQGKETIKAEIDAAVKRVKAKKAEKDNQSIRHKDKADD